MGLLDRLVIKEMIGPWIFGVTMFSVVLMAGTYLFRLTDFIVKGVDASDVVRLSILFMPALVAKTFPMAVLLSSLLAFARLSNDSEIIAAQTGGASLYRIMRPVAIFGLAVAALSFVFGEYVVPNAATEASGLLRKIQRGLGQTSQPFTRTLYGNDGKVWGQLASLDINFSTGSMSDATIVWFGGGREPQAWAYFKELYYVPGRSWEARGAHMFKVAEDGVISESEFERSRPLRGWEDALDFSPQSALAETMTDNDSMSMRQLGEQIRKMESAPKVDEEARRKLRDRKVGYWTKVSLPLTAVMFALLGAPVSIRRVRQSAGIGVGISIAIIFGYYLLHSYMTVLAKGGAVNPAFSAFFPVAVGFGFAVALLIKRNH
ncbi:MAG: LptF/LptG family permease [Armatimonadetes bacterium]|nr:LptF/LptG family permease [Armatimonadota bacterium]